jgi:hypothetical protein
MFLQPHCPVCNVFPLCRTHISSLGHSNGVFQVVMAFFFKTGPLQKQSPWPFNPYHSPLTSCSFSLVFFSRPRQNYGATLLMKQLAELSKNPNESFSVGMDGENIFKWNVLVVGPPDSMYEGGFFKSVLEFPNDFPNSPPVMTFTSTMWHPNSK